MYNFRETDWDTCVVSNPLVTNNSEQLSETTNTQPSNIPIQCTIEDNVMPLNILRHNQAYKFMGSRFKSNARILLRVCLSTESQCSSRIQVDCKTSKEQAEVYYRTTISLYTIRPHVKGKVKVWKTAYTCKDAACMKSQCKAHVLETRKKRSRWKWKVNLQCMLQLKLCCLK